MNDLISRKAIYKKTVEWESQALYMAHEALNKGDQKEFTKWSIIHAERTAFKFDIAGAPSVPSSQHWIPCDESLPEDDKEVLVSSYDGTYIAEYDPSDCNWYETVEYRRVHGVVAWMPLPEPYRRDE